MTMKMRLVLKAVMMMKRKMKRRGPAMRKRRSLVVMRQSHQMKRWSLNHRRLSLKLKKSYRVKRLQNQ